MRSPAGNWVASAKRTLTVDMDSEAVRLLETRGRKITRWATLPLQPGDVQEGVVSNARALSNTLRQLVASCGARGGPVVASVSGLYSVSRILALPARVAVADPVAFLDAARAAMPVGPEKLYLSCWTIAGNGGHQALAVGVPREVIDSTVPALRAGGLDPSRIELKAMALARAVDQKQAMVLNIEPASLDIVMLANGVPETMRTVAWRCDGVVVEDRIGQLKRALETTVDFFNAHHPESPMDAATPLFITGQMSGDPALEAGLQDRLRFPIKELRPPLEYPSELPVSRYAVNIGLALKGDSPPAGNGERVLPDINLLPETYRPWKPSGRHVAGLSVLVAATASLFFLYQFTTGAISATDELQKSHDLLNSQVQQRQTESKSRLPMQKAVDEFRIIQGMDAGLGGELAVLVSEAKRLNVQVKSIAHRGESVAVESEARDYTAFMAYVDALRKTGKFASVTPPPEGYPYVSRGTIEIKTKPRK